MNALAAASLDEIVKVIQSSLAPAFLLTAIASLLSVFTQRLARISDQVKALSDLQSDDPLIKHKLATLRVRSRLLDAAVILGALAGAAVAGAVLTLFLALVQAKSTATILFYLFGLAVIATIGALASFMFEVLIASSRIRADVDRSMGPKR